MSDIVIDPATTPDNVIEAQIDCYSWMWSKSDAQCGGCLVRDRCITAIVTKRIPGFVAAKGGPLEPADFENTECQSDAESAAVLLQISKGKKISDLLPAQYVTAAPVVEAPPPPAEEPTFTQPPLPVKPAKKVAPKKAKKDDAPAAVEAPAAAVEAPAPVAEVEPVGASIHAPPPEPTAAPVKATKEAEAPKKAAPVKKAAPPVVAPVPETKAPKKEAPMKKAAKPATTKATHAVASEKEVANRTKKAKAPKYDKDVFDAAWERERSRSPAVAKVAPGAKLQKSYRGTEVEVEYQKGFVLFEGSKWPTLASVKNAVVGKKDYPRQNGGDGTRAMTDWSVPRFFQLGATKKTSTKVVKKKETPKKVAKKATKKAPAKKKG